MSFADIAALTIHDVKNQLAQLAGHAERNGDNATVRIAMEAADTLTQLLTFYKSENGILRFDIEAHSPSDLIDELANEMRGIGTHRIDQDLAAAPTLAFYDAALVRMVLANALHNALRYAKSRIVLTVSERGPHVEFSVRDDGPGYPASVLADQGETAAVSRGGTGLGLRLARRIAALHENGGVRGEILLANDSGGVFTLRLPK
jgi:signal transduction histidine kinase